MKNDYHQFLTCRLNEVKEIIHNQEANTEIVSQETSPPNSDNHEGQKRVINIKRINKDKLVLIWCYENYN
jgi:hypothetical protein